MECRLCPTIWNPNEWNWVSCGFDKNVAVTDIGTPAGQKWHVDYSLEGENPHMVQGNLEHPCVGESIFIIMS
jgi:hypothetical protein